MDPEIRGLFSRLGVFNPPNNVINRLYDHNADIEFASVHLNELRGPSHWLPYKIVPLHTFRLRDLPYSHEFRKRPESSQSVPSHLLLQGIPKDVVYDALLRDGLKALGQPKGYFGPGYYFTNCSTKAANYTFPTAWKSERDADLGNLKPHHGKKGLGYLLYCEVATGIAREHRVRTKSEGALNIALGGSNSLYYPGVFKPECVETCLDDYGSTVLVPRGPLLSTVERGREVNPQEDMHYDEVFIRNRDQILPRILVEAEFLYDGLDPNE